MILCWAIWTGQIACDHGEGGRSVLASTQWTMDAWVDIAQVGMVNQSISAQKLWIPPEEGF